MDVLPLQLPCEPSFTSVYTRALLLPIPKHILETASGGGQVRTRKERGRNHNIRDKQEKADPILVVTFQQQVTIYSTEFQLTQSDGNAVMHVLITASVYPLLVLEWDNIHLVITLLS